MRHVHADRLDACPACHAAGRAEAIAEVVAVGVPAMSYSAGALT